MLSEGRASSGQERLWFLDRLHPHLRHNLTLRLRLDGPLDVAALRRAVRRLVRMHDALHTTFHVSRSGLMQRMGVTTKVELEIIDAATAGISSDDIAESEANRRFDLELGPLVRFALVRITPSEHDLVVTAHHVVADWSSLRVMLEDLARIYRGEPVARPSTLYKDYADWQRTMQESERAQLRLRRRRAALAEAPGTTTFPPDRPRPAVQRFRGARFEFEVEGDLAAHVRALARQQGATVFAVLLADLGVLLQRHLGRDDLVIAALVDGRAVAGIDRAVGFYANTVPMRIVLEPQATFMETLGRVRGAALEALEAQDIPFDVLIRDLRLPRDLNAMPLTQIALVVQHEALHFDLPDVEARILEPPPRAAEFDLSINVDLSCANRIRGQFAYDAELYWPSSIERLSDEFVEILAEATAYPERVLSDLPWRIEGDRVADHGDPVVVDRCLLDRFDEAVRHTYAEPAIISDHDQSAITYGDLQGRVNALADALLERGLRSGSVVALCVGRSVDLVVGMLGIMRAGGIYLPLDPTHPAGRLSFILDDAGATFVVTQTRLLSRLREHSVTPILLDGHGKLVAETDEPSRIAGGIFPGRPHANNGAYLIYTSGSTGTPKGVLVTHGNLASFCDSIVKILGEDTGVWLASTTISFDIAALELLWPLTRGHRIVIQTSELERITIGIDRPGVRRGADVASSPLQQTLNLIKTERITHFQCTPTTAVLLSYLADGLQTLARLKHLLIGGEQFPRQIAERLNELPNTCVWNMYGPTEATIWASVQRVASDFADIPIGRPLAHAETYVVDQDGSLVSPGVQGEIAIGGPCVAAGYWKAPGLTATRFRPNSIDKPGSRLYRTGDVGWMRADGTLFFSGRKDNQVKVRGVRIELGEIEAALQKIPIVEHAIVRAIGEGPGRQLAAYVVLNDSNPDEGWRETIGVALRAALPSYMVPPHIISMPAFPMTPNGKVDRQGLPAPDECRSESNEGTALDEVERQIALAWSSVLGRGAIDPDLPFFDAGGDSLRLIQLQLALREHLAVDVELVDLFHHQTIAALAGHLRATPLA